LPEMRKTLLDIEKRLKELEKKFLSEGKEK
jgi:hypothetical protein